MVTRRSSPPEAKTTPTADGAFPAAASVDSGTVEADNTRATAAEAAAEALDALNDSAPDAKDLDLSLDESVKDLFFDVRGLRC